MSTRRSRHRNLITEIQREKPRQQREKLKSCTPYIDPTLTRENATSFYVPRFSPARLTRNKGHFRSNKEYMIASLLLLYVVPVSGTKV